MEKDFDFLNVSEIKYRVRYIQNCMMSNFKFHIFKSKPSFFIV